MTTSEQARFEKWLEKIKEVLTYATCHFKVWQQLWPSTEEKARVFNYYRNFFNLTQRAHNLELFMDISKILDKRKDSINLWRVLSEVKEKPYLLKERKIDIEEIEERLTKNAELFKRLKTFRNKVLAHIDEKYHVEESNQKKISIYVGETRGLLRDLDEIVTEISVAYNGVIPSFETVGIDDTEELLNKLINIEGTEQ